MVVLLLKIIDVFGFDRVKVSNMFIMWFVIVDGFIGHFIDRGILMLFFWFVFV